MKIHNHDIDHATIVIEEDYSGNLFAFAQTFSNIKVISSNVYQTERSIWRDILSEDFWMIDDGKR